MVVFDPISLQEFFEEVQKEFPHYNQAIHTKWQQRYDLPKSEVRAPAGGSVAIGHVSRQMADFVKEILRLQEKGFPLKLAFEQIDERMIEALGQIVNKDVDSETYLYFQRKERTLFTPHLKKIVETLQDYGERTFKKCGSEGKLSREQINAHDDLLNDISIEVFRYLMEYNRVYASKRALKPNIFMNFDHIAKLEKFCFMWGASRGNREILRLCSKIGDMYSRQYLDDPDEE